MPLFFNTDTRQMSLRLKVFAAVPAKKLRFAVSTYSLKQAAHQTFIGSWCLCPRTKLQFTRDAIHTDGHDSSQK